VSVLPTEWKILRNSDHSWQQIKRIDEERNRNITSSEVGKPERKLLYRCFNFEIDPRVSHTVHIKEEKDYT